MTKQEMNDIFKANLVEQAMESKDYPDDIADVYLNWLHGKIMLAQQKLQQQKSTPQQDSGEKPAA